MWAVMPTVTHSLHFLISATSLLEQTLRTPHGSPRANVQAEATRGYTCLNEHLCPLPGCLGQARAHPCVHPIRAATSAFQLLLALLLLTNAIIVPLCRNSFLDQWNTSPTSASIGSNRDQGQVLPLWASCCSVMVC